MPRFVSSLSLFAVTVAVLGAGCAPDPMQSAADAEPDGPEPMGDRVEIIGDAVAMPDLVRDGEVALEGAAETTTLSVGEWMQLAATNGAERHRAEQMIASGAYLGDPVSVVQMQLGEGTGSARYDTGRDIGEAFETEFLHRFTEDGGEVVFTLVGPGAGAGGGRAMPSLLQVNFMLGRPIMTDEGPAVGKAIVIFLGDSSGATSELARMDLPDDLDVSAFAQRFGVRCVPGTVTVLLNGEPVLEAAARLGGGPAIARIRTTAMRRAPAYLLRWTFEAPE